MKPKMIKPLEKDIQRAITDYLDIRRIFYYRNNSGAVVIPERRGGSRFLRFGAEGSPDFVCVIMGRYVGLEVKRPGNRQSEAQKAFEKRLQKAGGTYFVVYSVNEVATHIDALIKGLTN